MKKVLSLGLSPPTAKSTAVFGDTNAGRMTAAIQHGEYVSPGYTVNFAENFASCPEKKVEI